MSSLGNARRIPKHGHYISVTLLTNIVLGYAYLCAGFNFLIYLDFKCNCKPPLYYKVFYHPKHLSFTVGRISRYKKKKDIRHEL